MQLETSDRPDLKVLTATIARSPIVVTERGFAHGFAHALAHLPAGFEKVDLAILRWITADSRRASHSPRAN